MIQHEALKDRRGQQINLTWDDEFPRACPNCHKAISPLMAGKFISRIGSHDTELQILYQCPSPDCEHMFFAIHRRQHESGREIPFRYVGVAPHRPVPAEFTLEILELSPMFVDIYNQSLAAEAYTLTELTGIGYRKALEFLVKDYLKHKFPDRCNEIEAKFLGPCIEQDVDDPRIKECARRAVWLGNDETHYVRKWRNRDVTDLKTLIRLTINWIESELLTEKYIAEMQR